MGIKKPLLVVGALTGIGLAGVTGLGVASAATSEEGADSLVNKIATRFNLNEDEVEAVFEEAHAERQAEHTQKVEERLSELVAEGKITEDQKAAIMAKAAELQPEHEAMHESFKDMTREERRAQMQQHREELKAWAQQNDIPVEQLREAFGFHRHEGPGGHHSHMMDKHEQ